MRYSIAEGALSLYTTLQPLYAWAFLFVVLVLIPLGLFDRTRAFAATGILLCSYLFGVSVWLVSLAVALYLLGWGWLIFGVLLGGVGVVPIAFIGALLKGEPGYAFGVIGLGVLITFATRAIAHKLVRTKEISAYSLRHSFGSETAADGVPLYSLAHVMGSSIRMIEKHYGHHDPDRARAHLARVFGSADVAQGGADRSRSVPLGAANEA